MQLEAVIERELARTLTDEPEIINFMFVEGDTIYGITDTDHKIVVGKVHDTKCQSIASSWKIEEDVLTLNFKYQ